MSAPPAPEYEPGLNASDYPQYPMPLNTGDPADDDATIMDTMLNENPDPGIPVIVEPAEPTFQRAPVATRTLTGTQRIAVNADSVRILNKDPNRLSLYFYLNSALAGIPAPDDKILMAQDNSAVEGKMGGTLISLYNCQVPLDWSFHTGEVWAKIPPGFAASAIDVSWIAVTR
jgi:hypothetical protein